jgi:cytochrome c5
MSLIKKAACTGLLMGLMAGLAGCGGESEEVVLTAKQEQAAAERLAPAGSVTLEGDVVGAAPVVAAGGEPRTGEAIYNKSCMSCHMTGAAGAPILGDAAAWSDRIAQGIDTLYTHAISGIRGMPPKGLCMDCSDEELHNAVDYMVENSQ